MRAYKKILYQLAVGFCLSFCKIVEADDEELWFVAISLMCGYQDPAYRAGAEKILGDGDAFNSKRSAQKPVDWNVIDKRPVVQCFQSRQWLSKSLCTDVELFKGYIYSEGMLYGYDRDSVEALHKKHLKETEGLGVAFDYLNAAALEHPGTSTPCPTTK
jgi:hypothetical protein